MNYGSVCSGIEAATVAWDARRHVERFVELVRKRGGTCEEGTESFDEFYQELQEDSLDAMRAALTAAFPQASAALDQSAGEERKQS